MDEIMICGPYTLSVNATGRKLEVCTSAKGKEFMPMVSYDCEKDELKVHNMGNSNYSMKEIRDALVHVAKNAAHAKLAGAALGCIPETIDDIACGAT